MDPTILLAVLSLGAGLVVVALGARARSQEADPTLAEILGLPEDETPPAAAAAPEHGVVASGTLKVATLALDRLDRPGSLRSRIERADVSLRPAELLILGASVALVAGVALQALTGLVWLAPLPLLVVPFALRVLLDWRGRRRANRFAAQLPDALGLVAGSLAAGHTFLRAIELMSDELEAPLSDEFRRVVAETQLGLPLVAALDRMADRLALRDVAWMVQAIRIQQTVGGQLAELLATLADFMRAREELRREVKVLTAEGRVSAWVLGAMPIALFVAVQVVNPGYVDPLLEGWGLVWLGLTIASMTIGIGIILKMVDGVDV